MQAHKTNLSELLKKHFGYPAFRQGQLEIIHEVLEHRDCLAIMPTGGGKSICYQLPGLAEEGITLVISPLIALMKDQVLQLRKRRIPALAVYSGMPFYDVKKTFVNACSGQFKFLYLSPERLQTKLFLEYLPGMPVNLLAVDEAHCISQWGHDFRPAYRNIAAVRQELAGIPCVALTASATPRVQRDIKEQLLMHNDARIIAQSFERPALSYSSFSEQQKQNRIVEILQKVNGSALVYCRSRRRTTDLAEHLALHNISSSNYHAGLSNEEREQRQHNWLHGNCRVMVCTNAFGMGIDKADVRCVIHADVPENLESYYQEAGRAGRDGKKAYAVLLHNAEELKRLEQAPSKKFISLQLIRSVYQQVANYLQLEDGKGENQSYTFNIYEFCERFKLNEDEVLHALQVLQQNNYVQFNDQVFIPATVKFTAHRDYIEEIERSRPDLEPLVKLLLRTYEGIMDYNIAIRIKTLAGILRQTEANTTEMLLKLQTLGVLQYQPLQDQPQVFFLQPRMPAANLLLNEKLYLERKTAATEQVKAMLKFVSEGRECRSAMLANYFGDKTVKPCGVCDNCLDRKRKQANAAEIQKAAEHILLVCKKPQTLLQIRQNSLGIPGRNFDAAMQLLIEEQLISQLGDGRYERIVA